MTPIAEVDHCMDPKSFVRATVRTKSAMQDFDGGTFFSCDLFDASGEIRAAFFNETAARCFPLLEEGKVYVFKDRYNYRVQPANRTYNSLSHEFEITFSEVIIEPCDDDAVLPIPPLLGAIASPIDVHRVCMRVSETGEFKFEMSAEVRAAIAARTLVADPATP